MPETADSFWVSLPGVEPGEDVLGVWRARPIPQAQPRRRAGSFAAPAIGARNEPGETEPATLWQVDLPRDPRQAASLLAGQEWRLAQAEQALPQAEQRLERYVEIRRQGAGSLAFDLRSGPEATLDAWLNASGAISFGGILGIPNDWKEVAARANALLKRFGQTAAYAAWVETSSGGKLVGRSTVAWNGDLRHFWLHSAAAEQAVQHQRSLSLALRSRLAWVKLSMLVLSGGLKLAVLSPVGPLAAIPAALQFFRQIIAQAQEIHAVQSEIATDS